MDYGLQLWSVRDMAEEKGLEATLKAVSEIGYKYVEFAGFYGHSAEEVKGWLDKYGLKCASTHTPWTDLVEDFEGTINYHKMIGADNIVFPSIDTRNPEVVKIFTDFCGEYIPRAKAEGINIHFHNHTAEFALHDDGFMVYPVLEMRTELMFQPDIYQVYMSKVNPIDLINRLKDRIAIIHLKDGNDGGSLPLGKGAAPVAEVVALAKELGLTMIVESDTCSNPSGIEEARISLEYLKSLE